MALKGVTARQIKIAEEDLEAKKGKYFIGKVADFAKRKGWFFRIINCLNRT